MAPNRLCRSFTLGLAVLTALCAKSPTLFAQISVGVPRDVTTPDPLGFFTALPGTTCKDGTGQAASSVMYDGTFLKINTNYQIDTSALVTGFCDIYILGQFWHSFTRYIQGVGITGYPPSGSNWYQPVVAAPGRQDLDTHVPGTSSGPIQDWLSEVGTHRITFRTYADPTNCQIPQYSAAVEKTLNGVACLPTWRLGNDELPDMRRFPVDETPISVVYPPEMDDSVRAAVQGWNSQLTAPHFNPVPDGTCEGLGGHCVEVGYRIITCRPNSCSCNQPGGGDPYQSPAQISIVADWGSMMKTWNVSHELGHLLGLAERTETECDNGLTTMSSHWPCTEVPPGSAVTATLNDSIAVADGIYGRRILKTCGW